MKRKCLKNLGKKYVTKKGKAVDEKTMGPPCKCRYKCFDKMSQQQRLDCFTKFWQLGDRTMQWNFIIKYFDKIKVNNIPYVVRNVNQTDVFNCNNKVWIKDTKGKKINWSNIREVHADGSDPN